MYLCDFLDQHTGQTPRLILTLNGSEDTESRKNVPFETSDPYLKTSNFGPKQSISSQNSETRKCYIL